MRKSYLVFAALWMAFALTSCLTVKNSYEEDDVAFAKQDGTDTDTDTDTKAGRLAAVRAIFKAHGCGTSGCHASGSGRTYVDGISDAEWISKGHVAAGSPTTSYLWGKLNHSGCGNGDCNMPPSQEITDAEMAVIQTWIEKINVEDTQ